MKQPQHYHLRPGVELFQCRDGGDTSLKVGCMRVCQLDHCTQMQWETLGDLGERSLHHCASATIRNSTGCGACIINLTFGS
jgi:hypothetical protein